jgi:hypothetical protein
MALAVTVPDQLEMIVGEQLNLAIDFTNLIAAGDVLTVPGSVAQAALVQSASTNELVPSAIIDVPFITNSVIMNVTVSSTYLRPKTDYVLRLTCTATGGAGVKVVSAILVIRVVY